LGGGAGGTKTCRIACFVRCLSANCTRVDLCTVIVGRKETELEIESDIF
jgi:hypothetical protein